MGLWYNYTKTCIMNLTLLDKLDLLMDDTFKVSSPTFSVKMV